ncbi:26S proteasome regulatory complex, non-ATPase subcomplex, Rpn1 subunit [Trema orientale]|uniref:26S proteasome regulatory complex, non-ATPase subcomplex, Rpn1 subunit n=1 Tax=Trema orientale TaxID=63057 RepID=A0A2P5CTH6_TREOI|nr:26S proteasome regulatory complex, non-ATPase subcomplex, Rpn1 subunit [Trema orientale]
MDHNEDEGRVGGEHSGKQDDEEAVARLEEIKKSIEAKMTLRQSNSNPERPGFLRTLDSSIKRNTAVIKKLKQINEEQREGLLDELRNVNLSKFVSEAVTSICDAKLRSSDIQAAVQICSLLHQRYKDFSPSLVQGLLKVFFPGKSGDDSDTDRNLKAMKKRSTLKLLLELYFVGVIEDSGIFVNIIKDLTSIEHLKDRDATQTNLTLLASFARQGRLFLGLSLSGQEVYEEFFKGLNITADQKKFFRKALHTYYEAAAELLQTEHTSLRQLEHENAKILNAKGELSDENVASYEKLRKSYDHLYRSVSSLAEALDMQPPVMPEDGHTTRVTSGEDASSTATGKDSSVLEAIWDDEDTRSFYECLPDLRAFVPAVLLGEAEAKLNEQSVKTQEQSTELAPESDQGQQATLDTGEISTDSGASQEGRSTEKGKDKEEKDKEKSKDPEREKGKEKDSDKKGENEKEKLKSVEGTNLDALLQRLPGCVSRDLIDQLTVEFCYLNSKANRKKLVRALFNVPRTSLELIAYYSRMVATLSTCMKDVSSMLLQMLEEEFNFLINKKDQMNIETKIRNIRFIGELCKFKIAPAGLVFSCLKACLDEFTHHNIDVACNLLETCGRFLYRSPETTVRMANMLEILMRLKNVKNLDPRHSTLVENAYYLCKPPERSARIAKVRPPLHQYIRKLLFSDLDKSTIEHVLRQLRKLPWSECESYLLKCFMKVHRGKYGQIHLIASLTAGLSRYHDEFAVAVVDEVPSSFPENLVLEEIRLGLELNDYGMQQRRIAHMRFLGELYNYEHVDSSVIFETLYLILVFGHGSPEQDLLDPPEDCFRMRMIITLLETCGHYFDRGKYCSYFLISFIVVVLTWCKFEQNSPEDLFADLRPSMTRYSFIEEVNAALVELEEHERTLSTDKASSEKYSDTEIRSTSNSISANGQSVLNGTEENGGVHDDLVDSDTDSGSGTLDPEGHDEEELDEGNHDDECDTEEDDDDDDGGGPASDEDEVHVRQKVMEVDPQEAASFEQELRAESMDQRRQDLRGRPALNMMIPMNVFEGSTKDHHGRGIGGESGDEALDEEARGSKEVQVKVLVKRGNKQQTKQMYIPRDCSLVQSTKQKEAAELEEKQDIKRLVLEYNDREEEELNGLGTQTLNHMQSGSNRVSSRGHLWEGTSGKTGGTRHRHHNYPHSYSGGGLYYSRKK